MTDNDRANERLHALVRPEHTAVLTMELQNGVVGPDALLPALRDLVAEVGLLDAAGAVCRAARAAGARVVHATVEDRPDGAGSTQNCKLFALAARRRRETGGGPTDIGTPGAEVVAELDRQPADLVVPRMSGMTPFTPSALDQVLRNLGVRTIVLVGVSLNLGIIGAALSALDLGYDVVVPRDAVVGIPREYGEQILANSMSMIATITTSAELSALWSAAG